MFFLKRDRKRRRQKQKTKKRISSDQWRIGCCPGVCFPNVHLCTARAIFANGGIVARVPVDDLCEWDRHHHHNNKHSSRSSHNTKKRHLTSLTSSNASVFTIKHIAQEPLIKHPKYILLPKKKPATAKRHLPFPP